jgi:hypothetical protein
MAGWPDFAGVDFSSRTCSAGDRARPAVVELGPSPLLLDMSLAGLLWLLPVLGTFLALAAGAVMVVQPHGRAFVFLLSTEGVVLAATAVALIAYVASEDDYRKGGISRWEAYDAEGVTVTAIAFALAAITAVVVALRRRSSSVAVLAVLAALAACVLQTAAFLANSLN